MAVLAEGFPVNGQGTFSYAFPELGGGFGYFPFSTDQQGRGETSIGFGLGGVDDPLLEYDLVITIDVNGTSVTETVDLICDPAANAPGQRTECSVDGFRVFLGYSFVNRGDCVAFVSTEGRNEPGRNIAGAP